MGWLSSALHYLVVPKCFGTSAAIEGVNSVAQTKTNRCITEVEKLGGAVGVLLATLEPPPRANRTRSVDIEETE